VCSSGQAVTKSKKARLKKIYDMDMAPSPGAMAASRLANFLTTRDMEKESCITKMKRP